MTREEALGIARDALLALIGAVETSSSEHVGTPSDWPLFHVENALGGITKVREAAHVLRHEQADSGWRRGPLSATMIRAHIEDFGGGPDNYEALWAWRDGPGEMPSFVRITIPPRSGVPRSSFDPGSHADWWTLEELDRDGGEWRPVTQDGFPAPWASTAGAKK